METTQECCTVILSHLTNHPSSIYQLCTDTSSEDMPGSMSYWDGWRERERKKENDKDRDRERGGGAMSYWDGWGERERWG